MRERKRERQTDRERKRDEDRKRDRDKVRQTDIHTKLVLAPHICPNEKLSTLTQEERLLGQGGTGRDREGQGGTGRGVHLTRVIQVFNEYCFPSMAWQVFK